MANNIDCYAMIWKPSDNSWGFFNLGINGTISFNGFPVAYPVFSFCPDGKVRIYPRSRMISIQRTIDGATKNYEVGALVLSRSVTQINNFTSKLKNYMDETSEDNEYDYEDANDYYIECPLKKTVEFYNYTANYHNCFYAVAKWFEWMGDTRMLNEFKPSQDACKEYIPAAFKASSYFSSSNWPQTTFDGD